MSAIDPERCKEVSAQLAQDANDGEWWDLHYLLACIRVQASELQSPQPAPLPIARVVRR